MFIKFQNENGYNEAIFLVEKDNKYIKSLLTEEFFSTTIHYVLL